MLSHFMPEQIDTAISLTDEAQANHLQLNQKTVSLIGEKTGPFALIAHESYLIERIRDVKTIVIRMKSNRELMSKLSVKENALRPKKRIYQKKPSIPVRKVWEKSQEIHNQMKLDMESLYIFGNLLLDQWAHVVGYVLNDKEPQKFNFATFVDKLQKKGDKGPLEFFLQRHHQDIFWLFYQLRMYRNVFIEHMRVPRQRGTTRTTDGHDFKLFSPTSIGWLSDEQIEKKIESIMHLAPHHIKIFPANAWHKGNMRSLLTEIFYNIDQVVEQSDREKIWNVWHEVGGLTPSYDVTAMRLMRFIASSLLTIMDIISINPSKVNLGEQQIPITS